MLTKDRTGAIIAIDPGEKRTGIAVYDLDGSTYCLSREPWQAATWLDTQPSKSIELVILEQWVPYPHAQAGNAWRDLVEVKTLGALEYICRSARIKYVYQQTSILLPTAARAEYHGYRWTSSNRDEKAAETHLYHYLNQGRKNN